LLLGLREDAHYLIAAPFVVISAEDGEGESRLSRPASRCVSWKPVGLHETEEGERKRDKGHRRGGRGRAEK